MSDAPSHLEELLRHRDFVRRLARRLVRDEARADDVVQDTYVAALRNPPRHAGALRAWLASVVRKIAFTQRRAERRREDREEHAPPARELPSPAEAAEKAQWHQRVVNAVMELSDPYRATLLLRYFEDLNSSEIADVHGVPAATVRTRIKRGLEQLRERMDRDAAGNRATWMHGLLFLGWRRDELAAATRAVQRPTPAPLAPLAIAGAVVGIIAVLGFLFWASGSRNDAGTPRVTPQVESPRGDAPTSTSGVFVHAPRPAGVPLDVTVLGAGRPVADALVVLARRRGHPWRFSPGDRWVEWDRGRTDEAGVARFLPAPSGYVRVFAVGDGFARGVATVFRPRELEYPVVVELQPERAVAFHVTDARTGRPLVGARVHLHDWMPAAAAETGADGAGVLLGVPADGRCLLRATAVGYAPGTPRAPPETGVLELRLEPQGRTLRWSARHGPRDGSAVVVRRLTEATGRPGRLDNGMVVAAGFSPGLVPELLAIAPDGSFARLSAPEAPPDRAVGSTTFAHPPRLTVTVRDGSGPVDGIDVRLVGASGHTIHPVGRTGPDGRAILPVYAADAVELRVRDGRHAVFRAAGRFDPASGDATLDVALAPGREVVLAIRHGFPPGTEILADRTLVAAQRMASDARRFRVRGPGPVAVHVLAPGYLPATRLVDPSEAEIARLDIELQRGSRLAVQVVRRSTRQPYRLDVVLAQTATPGEGVPGEGSTTEGNSPAENTTAGNTAEPRPALRRGPWQFRLYVGPDGVVRETMLPPGYYRVRDRVTGVLSKVFRAGRQPVQVRMDLSRAWPPAPLVVRGRVASVRGLDLAAAHVIVTSPNGVREDRSRERQLVRVGSDGSFSFDWEDRPIRIAVRHPYAAPGHAVTLTTPRDDLVLELVPHRARIRLDPAPSPPVEYETAPRVRLPGAGRTFDAVLEGGVLRFAGFEPGRATVLIDVAGFAPAQLRDIDLRPGETDLGTLALRRGSRLRVRVIGRAGEPLPSLIVSAQGPGYQRSLHTGGRAAATLEGLGRGRFRVTAWESPGGFRVFRTTIESDGESRHDVEIDLR